MSNKYFVPNGFHTSTTSYADGIDEWLSQMDENGVPFCIKCVAGSTGLVKAARIMAESTVPHVAIWRLDRFPFNQGESDIPDPHYQIDPVAAAQRQMQYAIYKLPPEVGNPFIEIINEPAKEIGPVEWVGRFCLTAAKMAVAQGKKFAGPGYSGGTPESWEAPSMLEFLRYAGLHRDSVAVAIHEYSFVTDDILRGDGYLVGRYKKLIETCRRHGIGPVTILITEWGWAERNVPTDLAVAKTHLQQAAQLYAQDSQWVKGAVIWALDKGWGNLHQQTHALMPVLLESAADTPYTDDQAPTPPKAGPEPPPFAAPTVYKVVVNLLPQSTTFAEIEMILNPAGVPSEYLLARETFVFSADDAVQLARSGNGESFVRCWEPGRWDADGNEERIIYWLQARGVTAVPVYLKPKDPESAPTFPLPTDRSEMPLVVDISKWQARRHPKTLAFIPDTIDWQTMIEVGQIKGVIMRSSIGRGSDSTYPAWLAQARQSVIKDSQGNRYELPIGLYHYLWPSDAPTSAGRILYALEQAEYFASIVRQAGPIIFGCWLDIEDFEGKYPTVPEIEAFIDRFESVTGKRIGIYTNPNMLMYKIKLSARHASRPLWIAHWGVNRPSISAPWNTDAWGKDNTVKIWQYAASLVPGHDRAIDVNVLHKSKEAFDYWIAENGIPAGSGGDPAPTPPAPNPSPAPIPPNPAPTPPKPRTGMVRYGLHASADSHIEPDEAEIFQLLQPQVIKVLSSTPAAQIAGLAAQHPDATFIVRAYLSFGGRKVTPANFVDWTLPDVKRSVDALAGRDVWVEIHNEPNLALEGCFTAWADGHEFGRWLHDVLAAYRSALKGVQFLFPGLSPGHGAAGERFEQWAFLDGADSVAHEFDGIGLHAYWSWPHYPIETATQQVENFANRYPAKPLAVTEFSNNGRKAAHGGDITPAEKATEYAAFLSSISSLNIVGATAFVATGRDPIWGWGRDGHGETWTKELASAARTAISKLKG